MAISEREAMSKLHILFVIKSHDISKPLFLMVGHNAPHSANEGALMQAPPDIVRAMGYIDLPQRRYYAAMVKKLDDSIGDIIKALLDKGILENSIIVFISDNGGMTTQAQANYASNWPLRGVKMSPFEGGIRVNGLIWTKNFTKSEHLWKGYMHVSDWTPTILSAVGIKPPSGIDGVDLWETIKSNGESKRDVIVEIDDYTGFAAIIKGDYKLVSGTVKTEYSNYQGHIFKGITRPPPLYEDTIRNSAMYTILSDIGIDFKIPDIKLRNKIKISCNENKGSQNICYPSNGTWCLFNIKEDPCESQDLSSAHPEIVNKLYSRLQIEIKRTIPRKMPHEVNLKSKPSLHNNTWDVWHPSENKL